MPDEKRWTWEDIVHLPEREQPEIIDGQPYYRAVPRARHGIPQFRFARAFVGDGFDHVDGHWWISVEPAVRLGPHAIVGPDLAGWRKERVPELPDDWPLDVRPDWVCEVLSPTDARLDRGTKAQAYAAAEVPWYWLVDPVSRTIEVWRLHAGQWLVHGCFGDGERLVLPPFDGAELAVSALFGPAMASDGRVG